MPHSPALQEAVFASVAMVGELVGTLVGALVGALVGELYRLYLAAFVVDFVQLSEE
jgi:hypothetical protein